MLSLRFFQKVMAHTDDTSAIVVRCDAAGDALPLGGSCWWIEADYKLAASSPRPRDRSSRRTYQPSPPYRENFLPIALRPAYSASGSSIPRTLDGGAGRAMIGASSILSGFIFEPPDFSNAQIGELNEFQDQFSV